MTRLRLGGPIFERASSPEDWIRILKKKGYEAAYAPLGPEAADSLIAEYRQAAQENDILIAEVGAWLLHPLSEDPAIAREGIEKTAERLVFADKIGARCCVNVSSSRGSLWDGPDARNLTDETFFMVVESVKEILRLANPQKACYALEMMPWMYPTGLEDMLRLMEAVDDPRFAVHYDPCNTVNTVDKYFHNGEMMEAFVEGLHDKILSIHCKDVELLPNMTMHFEERCPGDGSLEHDRLLKAVARLNPGIPIMLEHLPTEALYDKAAAHLRSVAANNGIEFAECEK